MAVTIKKVESRSQLRKFVGFPLKLYKNSETYVPGLFSDEMNTFIPGKNPALDFSDSVQFLAYKDGKLAGRVAAIINRTANERWNHNEVRYGWFDFIDDKEVSEALIEAVIAYGKENGMDTITGPLGFVDFDPEGMLVEGYEHLSTMFLRHNYLYYKDHMEAMGFVKEVDWLEYKIVIPQGKMPERFSRAADLVAQRYNLRVKKLTMKEIKRENYGRKLFELVNQAYGNLYNFTPIPVNLVDHYVNTILGFIDTEFITAVVNEKNEMVAFGVTMPAITRALQKSKGKLFPFGWVHLVKSLYIKREPNLELLLIGVVPEYRNKGVHAMIFADIMPRAIKYNITWAETNAELETNHNVQAIWNGMDVTQTKRRRIYTKKI